MKLISVTSRGNRLAKIFQRYAAFFPSRSHMFLMQRVTTPETRFFKPFYEKNRNYKSEKSALKAAENWLKGATI